MTPLVNPAPQQTMAYVLEEHGKKLEKHSEDISETKKAVFQIEKALIELKQPVSMMVKLMYFAATGILAMVGAELWRIVVAR